MHLGTTLLYFLLIHLPSALQGPHPTITPTPLRTLSRLLLLQRGHSHIHILRPLLFCPRCYGCALPCCFRLRNSHRCHSCCHHFNLLSLGILYPHCFRCRYRIYCIRLLYRIIRLSDVAAAVHVHHHRGYNISNIRNY